MSPEASQPNPQLRSPAEIMAAMAETAPAAPSAAELTTKFGTPDSEAAVLDAIKEDAEKGELGFSLEENVRDFAHNADQRDSEGKSHISLALSPEETSLDTLLPVTVQRAVHQAHTARTMGFRVGKSMDIVDGQLKVRMIAPRSDITPNRTPSTANGVVIDKAPSVDDQGTPMPTEVNECLLAGNSFMKQEADAGGRLNVEGAVDLILGAASRGEVVIATDHAFFNGGGSFARGVIEAAGYKTGQLEPHPDRPGFYRLPVLEEPAEAQAAPAQDLAIASEQKTAPAQLSGEEIRDMPYAGNKMEFGTPALKALVERLASDPKSLSPSERKDANNEAQRISGQETMSNKIAVVDGNGAQHNGVEYPGIFSFNGQMRGSFNQVPDDFTEWTPPMQLAGAEGMKGKMSHVIIEFEDGEKIMIRKTTPDIKSADDQTFDYVYTKRGRRQAEAGEVVERKDLPTGLLDGAVVIPGKPFVMGIDPKTGKPNRVSSSPVARVTAFKLGEQPHPWASKDPQRQRAVTQRFGTAMKYAPAA